MEGRSDGRMERRNYGVIEVLNDGRNGK